MRFVSFAFALLGIFGWRNGRSLKNILISTSSIPAEHFIGGDAKAQCNLIIDKVAHKLAYCEDVVHWDEWANSGGRATRRLLVSCDPNRKRWNTVMGPLADPKPRGALWVYAPNDKQQLVEVALKGYPDHADFHPLGVDVFPGSSSSDPARVLVVNHGRHNTTIEQFLLSPVAPYRATYVRTLTHPGFVSPNSVAFTSSSSFYVTQDHRFTRRIPGILGHTLPLAESLLLPGLAWVDHVKIDADGQLNITQAAGSISFPNGISISPNGNTVAVASAFGGAVNLYSRTEDNELTFYDSILVPFAADNIGYEDDGSLTVAGHPDFIAISGVAGSKKEHAPSWVVSITPRSSPGNASMEDNGTPYPVSRRVPASPKYEVKTLYQSDGSAFSTSTTGLWDESSKELYMAGLYQEGIMHCRG